MFVDHITIHAKAGDGGHGCSSFRREKFEPKGGPDGGDGGRGGDVVLVVNPHTDTLRDFTYKRRYKAENGRPGEGQKRTGRSGKDLILQVPPGTVVYRSPAPVPRRRPEDDFASEAEEEVEFEETDFDPEEESPETPEDALEENDEEDTEASEEGPSHAFGEFVVDLTQPGERFVLCKGGKGGIGNWRFRTDTNQAPIEFTLGDKGDTDWYTLELRRIADVGLIGFPNAGKSTLLRTLSNATPKVAAYPFTTLVPHIGVVEFDGYQRITVADIPGLIEGAHANVGLGHNFLRHISRCSAFLFVVDTAAVDQRDPITDIQVLRTEIKLYDPSLSERPWLIVANKLDLEEAGEWLTALQNRFPRQEIIPISADTGQGIDLLKEKLQELTQAPTDA